MPCFSGLADRVVVRRRRHCCGVRDDGIGGRDRRLSRMVARSRGRHCRVWGGSGLREPAGCGCRRAVIVSGRGCLVCPEIAPCTSDSSGAAADFTSYKKYYVNYTRWKTVDKCLPRLPAVERPHGSTQSAHHRRSPWLTSARAGIPGRLPSPRHHSRRRGCRVTAKNAWQVRTTSGCAVRLQPNQR